jgi:hypothetical protein
MRQSAKGWTQESRLAAVLATAAAGNRSLSVTLRSLTDGEPPHRVVGVPTISGLPHELSLRQTSGVFVAPLTAVVGLADCPTN